MLNTKVRIARPCTNLELTEAFYCDAIGFEVLGNFTDHQGFDGLILGHPGGPYHFEFTKHRTTPVKPTTTEEDLFVFYIPDRREWHDCIDRVEGLGHIAVKSLNPYWDKKGKTFVDPDGYRVVIQNSLWK